MRVKYLILCTVNKASESVGASSESNPLPVTSTSTDTPCPPEVERLVTSQCHFKQQIQILYYLTQLQMTSNNM